MQTIDLFNIQQKNETTVIAFYLYSDSNEISHEFPITASYLEIKTWGENECAVHNARIQEMQEAVELLQEQVANQE
jgi:hypothetical protein